MTMNSCLNLLFFCTMHTLQTSENIPENIPENVLNNTPRSRLNTRIPALLRLLRKSRRFLLCALLAALAIGSMPVLVHAQKSGASSSASASSSFPFDKHPLLLRILEWQDAREADSLIRALQTSSGEGSELVRARAALALASVQSKKAIEPLAKVLNDENPTARSMAAFALGQLGVVSATNTSKDPVEAAETALLQRWDTEKELTVRVAILEALGKCGGQTTIIRLTNNTEIKNPATPKSLTAAALLAIARLGLRKIMAPTVNSFCFEALRRPDATTSAEISFAASYIFARAPIAQWLPHADALAMLLTTKKLPPEAAINLARGYGKTKNWKYLETVKILAKSTDWRVRVECARAFGAMPSTNAVLTLLTSLSNDRSPLVRLTALEQIQRQLRGFSSESKSSESKSSESKSSESKSSESKPDAKFLQSLKSRANAGVSANGLDPRERAALLQAIAVVEPAWAWSERERWKAEQHIAFQSALTEAIGNANDLEALKYLQTLVLRGQMLELFSLNNSLSNSLNNAANASAGASIGGASKPASTSASVSAPANALAKLSAEERRTQQRKDILAAAALRGIATNWKRYVAPELLRANTSASATSASAILVATCERALQSGDVGLMSAAAEALGDTLLLPFGSVKVLVDRLEVMTSARDLEPMQAVINTLADLKAPEGLPMITQLLLDSNAALVQSATDAFEALTGQRPQMEPKKPVVKPLALDKLREVWANPTLQVSTKEGTFTMLLNVELAPLTSLNFYELAKTGAFNAVPFHRIVPNFVTQGGDFERGDGFGGPPYTIRSEFVPMVFERGIVGMASAGKDTEGSQWFVMHSYAPHLDGRYTAFARVPDGAGVFEQLQPYDEVVEVKVKSVAGAKNRAEK
jgi:cyclophilin family peptidyl-prolyl cis-trans isomerase/HEAT repeat protein